MKSPEQVKIDGAILRCQHCDHDKFLCRESLLNTEGLTFFSLDWLNKTAKNFICAKCGFVMWFVRDEEPEETREVVECFSCGSSIPIGQTICPECGWTYKGE